MMDVFVNGDAQQTRVAIPREIQAQGATAVDRYIDEQLAAQGRARVDVVAAAEPVAVDPGFGQVLLEGRDVPPAEAEVLSKGEVIARLAKAAKKGGRP